MRRRSFLGATAAASLLAGAARAQSPAKAAEPVPLPKPQTSGGKPLMAALNERKTSRNIAPEKLPVQTLSNLLWAAWGINRADGRRTAPTAMNVQDIEIFVFQADGVSRYDAKAHALEPVLAGDHRAKTGGQDGVATAAATLVYVTNTEKYQAGRDPALAVQWGHVHVGFIAQNVYLFAASEGIGAWFRASVDQAALASLLGLKPTWKVLYAQTVGRLKSA